VPSTAIIDPGLPTLPEVFDPATIGEQLGCVLPADWGSVQDVQLRIVKHHPGSRCTFEIAVRTARGERSLIGKVYASDRSDVYRAMEAIRRSGFGPQHAFSIPEPLAYVPELQLLLQEKVEGPRAKLIFLTADEAGRAEASARAARWLARFHAIAPRSGRVEDRGERRDAVERWSQRIGKMGESVASRARPLGRRARAMAAMTVIRSAWRTAGPSRSTGTAMTWRIRAATWRDSSSPSSGLRSSMRAPSARSMVRSRSF